MQKEKPSPLWTRRRGQFANFTSALADNSRAGINASATPSTGGLLLLSNSLNMSAVLSVKRSLPGKRFKHSPV